MILKNIRESTQPKQHTHTLLPHMTPTTEGAETQVSALLKSLDQMFVASYNNIFDTQIRVGEGAEALQRWEEWATAKIQQLAQSPPMSEFKQFTNDVVRAVLPCVIIPDVPPLY